MSAYHGQFFLPRVLSPGMFFVCLHAVYAKRGSPLLWLGFWEASILILSSVGKVCMLLINLACLGELSHPATYPANLLPCDLFPISANCSELSIARISGSGDVDPASKSGPPPAWQCCAACGLLALLYCLKVSGRSGHDSYLLPILQLALKGTKIRLSTTLSFQTCSLRLGWSAEAHTLKSNVHQSCFHSITSGHHFFTSPAFLESQPAVSADLILIGLTNRLILYQNLNHFTDT